MPYVFNKNLVTQAVLGSLLAVSFLLLVYVVVFPLQARDEERINAEIAREEADSKMKAAAAEQVDILKKLGAPPDSTLSAEKSDAKTIMKVWDEHIQSARFDPQRPSTIGAYVEMIETLLNKEQAKVSQRDETIAGLQSAGLALRSRVGDIYAASTGQPPSPADTPLDLLRAVSEKISNFSLSASRDRQDLEGARKERDRYKSALDAVDAKYAEQISSLNAEMNKVKKDRDTWKEKAETLGAQVVDTQVQQGTKGKDKSKSGPAVQEQFEATPDGEVILVRGNDKNIIGAVNIGRNDKARPGMIFEVIRGESRKGRIQLYDVADNVSYFRLIELYSENNPLVEGDQIHNPFYRRGIPTEFAVIGEFPSPLSRAKVIDRIREWGGTVVDAVTANTRYVVIGEGALSDEMRASIQMYNIERIALAGLREFLGEQ